MSRHVFVIGMDDFNRQECEALREQDAYRDCVFHPLLSYEALKQDMGESFDALLDKAKAELAQAEQVDGILTFWDFPAQSLLPFLCEQRDLPCATAEAIERCEHKYWARRLQQQIVPEAVPSFDAIDPYEKAEDLPPFEYPYWMKPVNSFSSFLAFHVTDDNTLRHALRQTRERIARIGDPYDELLAHLELPETIREIGGHHCIREGEIAGVLSTVEGYCFNGKADVYGVIDSVCESQTSSFARYQYPSARPKKVQQRMHELSIRLMERLPYEHGPFNIEFFYDEDNDSLHILEVNPRLSQSHFELFRQVDGLSHLAVAVDLALGNQPDFPKGKGRHAIAAKFFLRLHEDGTVKEVPGEDDIRALQKRFDDLKVKILVKPGDRLSDLKLQDSYSYQLAQCFIGAKDEDALLHIYDACVHGLPFRIEGCDEAIDEAADAAHQPAINGNQGAA